MRNGARQRSPCVPVRERKINFRKTDASRGKIRHHSITAELAVVGSAEMGGKWSSFLGGFIKSVFYSRTCANRGFRPRCCSVPLPWCGNGERPAKWDGISIRCTVICRRMFACLLSSHSSDLFPFCLGGGGSGSNLSNCHG